MNKYIGRTIETKILKLSKQYPVTVLTGPRQTGKSTLLRNLFPKYNYISFDDIIIRKRAKQDPSFFIETLKLPVIIDEIQYAPEILPYVKMLADKHAAALRNDKINGKLIFTGSQAFTLMSGLTESLAGRIALFELLPFSFDEIGKKPETAVKCYEQIARGFYPAPNTTCKDYAEFYGNYLSTYLERDIRQIINIHNLSLFQKFLELLAARAGNLLNITEISKECSIERNTASKWLSLLETSRIIYLLRPYFKNITKRIVKSPKLYFTDTGLLAYLLKYPDAKTLMAGAASGAIFENMIFIELLKHKFNTKENFDIYFYRDSNGVEVDFIIDKGVKKILIEVKSGKNINDMSAKNLKLTEISGDKYILSFYEHKLHFAKDITAIPWQEFSL